MNVPWQPRSRQSEGRQTEKEVVHRQGGRVHPNSGAGSIKDDGSSEGALFEVKDAQKTHTLHGKTLNSLFRRAVAQDKDAVYIVYFGDYNLTAEVRLRRGKG